jgi:stage II sporulation protein D
MLNRRIKLSIVLLVLASLITRGSEIRIGLFHNIAIESVVFSVVEGEYMLTGTGMQVAVIHKGAIFHIERNGPGWAVNDTAQGYGIFSELTFKGVSAVNIFQVKPVYPALPSKESEGDLTIRLYNTTMQLINSLEFEKYLPGCVESEGGAGALPEYYKAQAVIARTFALKNFHRHAHEGFNLCDGVHCQAYNGKSRMNKQIIEAVGLTEDEILADKTGQPVITAYHASCGGLTGSASGVWNKDLFYLNPVKDPFCDKSTHRDWRKTISMAAWSDYLNSKGYAGEPARLTTASETGRQKYLDPEHKKMPLTEVRGDLKLKSSYFHIEPGDNSVVICGHGYGHGLGLCQDGAMEMARVGYTYVDILMFYFSGLKLAKPQQ